MPPDAYVIGVKQNRSCPRSRFPTAANPVSFTRPATVKLARLR